MAPVRIPARLDTRIDGRMDYKIPVQTVTYKCWWGTRVTLFQLRPSGWCTIDMKSLVIEKEL